MSENCTAEDFAKASFARHPDLGLATRDGGINGDLWMDANGDECDDSEMAEKGWTPVVESRVTEHTLRDSQEKAERKRQRLIRHVSDLEGTIRRRGAALEDLREKLADAEQRAELAEWTQDKIAGEANDLRLENDRLERILQAPLSLRDLEVAWEAAERADECREGDVAIEKISESAYAVMTAPWCGYAGREFRILSRAPREPWVELAGVLHDVINQGGDDYIDVDSAAARLYAEGVRVTGGEES